MTSHYIWMIGNPQLEGHLRRANEERSAAVYAFVQWVGRVVSGTGRGVAAAVRRAQRRRRTYRELSGLSDRALQDIGLTRHELGHVAMQAADADPETGLTLAALRGREDREFSEQVVPFKRKDRNARRVSPQPADRQPNAA